MVFSLGLTPKVPESPRLSLEILKLNSVLWEPASDDGIGYHLYETGNNNILDKCIEIQSWKKVLIIPVLLYLKGHRTVSNVSQQNRSKDS